MKWTYRIIPSRYGHYIFFYRGIGIFGELTRFVWGSEERAKRKATKLIARYQRRHP